MMIHALRIMLWQGLNVTYFGFVKVRISKSYNPSLARNEQHKTKERKNYWKRPHIDMDSLERLNRTIRNLVSKTLAAEGSLPNDLWWAREMGSWLQDSSLRLWKVRPRNNQALLHCDLDASLQKWTSIWRTHENSLRVGGFREWAQV